MAPGAVMSKSDDRERVVPGHEERGRVHHPQVSVDRLVEGELVEAHGFRVAVGVPVVDAVDAVLRGQQPARVELDGPLHARIARSNDVLGLEIRAVPGKPARERK